MALGWGDVSAAIDALLVRRQKSDGEARSSLGLELAALLVDRDERLEVALDAIGEVLENAPANSAALKLAMRLVTKKEARDCAVAIVERALDGSRYQV